MFPFWLFLGTVTVLMGIFNRHILQLMGYRPMSEIMSIPHLKNSSRTVEQIAQWLMIILGTGFIVLGLGRVLPDSLSYKISFLFLGLSGILLLAMIGITLANWKAK